MKTFLSQFNPSSVRIAAVVVLGAVLLAVFGLVHSAFEGEPPKPTVVTFQVWTPDQVQSEYDRLHGTGLYSPANKGIYG